jgi:ATP sulfurylase
MNEGEEIKIKTESPDGTKTKMKIKNGKIKTKGVKRNQSGTEPPAVLMHPEVYGQRLRHNRQSIITTS